MTFIAAVVPGTLRAIAYVAAIWFIGCFTPNFVGGNVVDNIEMMGWTEIEVKTLLIVELNLVVLGGAYGVFNFWPLHLIFTPVEVRAAGLHLGFIIAAVRGRII